MSTLHATRHTLFSSHLAELEPAIAKGTVDHEAGYTLDRAVLDCIGNPNLRMPNVESHELAEEMALQKRLHPFREGTTPAANDHVQRVNSGHDTGNRARQAPRSVREHGDHFIIPSRRGFDVDRAIELVPVATAADFPDQGGNAAIGLEAVPSSTPANPSFIACLNVTDLSSGAPFPHDAPTVRHYRTGDTVRNAEVEEVFRLFRQMVEPGAVPELATDIVVNVHAVSQSLLEHVSERDTGPLVQVDGLVAETGLRVDNTRHCNSQGDGPSNLAPTHVAETEDQRVDDLVWSVAFRQRDLAELRNASVGIYSCQAYEVRLHRGYDSMRLLLVQRDKASDTPRRFFSNDADIEQLGDNARDAGFADAELRTDITSAHAAGKMESPQNGVLVLSPLAYLVSSHRSLQMVADQKVALCLTCPGHRLSPFQP